VVLHLRERSIICDCRQARGVGSNQSIDGGKVLWSLSGRRESVGKKAVETGSDTPVNIIASPTVTGSGAAATMLGGYWMWPDAGAAAL
jgi:hypothetical protein